MKTFILYIALSTFAIAGVSAQGLDEAKELYLAGEYAAALPIFEAEYAKTPTNAPLNQWYGVCLYKTGKNLAKAEELLLVASKGKIRDSFLYLGEIYIDAYRLTEAEDMYSKYAAMLNKRKDTVEIEKLEERKSVLARIRRSVLHTEDIQLIDSVVVDKADFLSAYSMSRSSGRVEYFNKVFPKFAKMESTVYVNEKETKLYYSRIQDEKKDSLPANYTLYSIEKLLDGFNNEKKLSADNFGLEGDVNYPFMMGDGVTIYFAAKDAESLGGYDLFISRYNMNNDTFLNPERLNMPFNSLYNDYLMVIDEEKGIGWFASDRFQSGDKVCVYTFIPNEVVRTIDNEDEDYLGRRAAITSIKDSWVAGSDYTKLKALAQKKAVDAKERKIDFEFVINDTHTYYTLADFRNKEAQELYRRVISMKVALAGEQNKLEALRVAYVKLSKEEKLTQGSIIVDLERQLEEVQKEIPRLEIQARNTEIGSLNN